jgi:hypothetical protein
MHWYSYVAAFLAGAFLANAVPHFVHGSSGDRFPTPFARPPGRGLSSPALNVAWALLNMAIGYALLRGGPVLGGREAAVGVFFAGVAASSLFLSVHMAAKHGPHQPAAAPERAHLGPSRE